jgi:hypothetical protein
LVKNPVTTSAAVIGADDEPAERSGDGVLGDHSLPGADVPLVGHCQV